MEQTQLLTELGLNSFIAFDFETTGLSPEDDRIIEIAAIRFTDGVPGEKFVSLVNPGRSITPEIADITGINDALVKDAPTEDKVVDAFLEFLGDAPLVAHNIPFDIAFLKALRNRFDREQVEHELYDTLQLSRAFLYFRPAHNLGSAAEYFGYTAEGSHRAEQDTINCGNVFVHLIEEAASYPLGVITKILEIIKKHSVPNKALYVNLANALTKAGDLKTGLTTSVIEKTSHNNRFVYQGKKDTVDYSIKEVFGTNGLLQEVLPGYETRDQQLDYALAAHEAFTENQIAVVEAGTGLGKTLAYLYPSIRRVFKSEEGSPTIISCHTKHLQDQLFYKDLPRLAQALDVSLEAVMLKGRNNYICRTRLDWTIADSGNILSPVEAECLLPLIIWLEWTATGDMSECTGFWSFRQLRVAGMIRSEPGFCTTPLCSRHNGCFFGPLRRSAYRAQIIVVNHALLLSEVSNPGILPPYKNLVVDEAHNLVKVAYSQFTLALDRTVIGTLVTRIDLEASGSVRLNNRLKELVKLRPALERPLENLRRDKDQCLTANREFFKTYISEVQNRFKVNAPYTEKKMLAELAAEFGSVHVELMQLSDALKEITFTLQRVEQELRTADNNSGDYLDIIQVFEQSRQQFAETLEILTRLTQKQDRDWVYWLEGRYRTGRSKKPELGLSICAAPINVAPDLVANLFSIVDSAVLTSATLRIDDSFNYFLNRTGLDNIELDNVVTREIDSPFHYDDQVKYLQLAGEMNRSKDPEYIADLVYRCHKHFNQRMMILFTSWSMLNGCYAALRQRPGGRDLPIFAQRSTASRFSLIKGMEETPNGILLGTDAFWEGVDLSGDLLEILIITKLPFDVPTEPIIKAYSEMLNQSGRNSFIEYSVPEAVIKFRQGFGRLIRSTTDEGIFIVLDERIVGKRYGNFFREAIPTPMSVFHTVDELLV